MKPKSQHVSEFFLYLQDGRVCRLAYSVAVDKLDLNKSESKT
jgi:hypothetical protein